MAHIDIFEDGGRKVSFGFRVSEDSEWGKISKNTAPFKYPDKDWSG